MPTIVGTALADASGTALQDASAELLGEPDVQVYVTYGGFMLAADQPTVWEELSTFLRRLGEAIALGKDFVETAVLANITNGIDMLLKNQKRLTWTGSGQTATYEGEENWTGYTLKKILDDILAIPEGGLTTEEHDYLLGIEPLGSLATGQAVWNYLIQHMDPAGELTYQAAGVYLKEAAEVAEYLPYSEGFELQATRWWRVWCTPGVMGLVQKRFTTHPEDFYIPADPDFTHVQAGDTLSSFLSREYPAISWTTIPPATGSEKRRIGFLCTDGSFTVYIGPGFTLPELQATHADLVIGEGLEVDLDLPPVWPGSGGVTLGTPVPLSSGFTITEAMDGVLVEVTSVDPGTLYYSYHNKLAYRHIGALAFFTDLGDLETYQALGFQNAIYVPRAIRRAAGVKVFTTRGAAGTITPWTITA